MDAFSDPTVETVVWVSSSQTAKTEVKNNAVGYHIDQDPAPILCVEYSVEMAETWSKDRLAPMLRDTPCLRDRVKDPRTRDSGNTLRHKVFKGGHITVVGANAAAGLASRPIRVLLLDEVDRYPASAGTEGDPVTLAIKRTANFWNRKIGMFSSPGREETSRIWRAYQASDRNRRWVPCPHCGEFQTLDWAGVKWVNRQESEDGQHHPETARYLCRHCGSLWSDTERWAALGKGEWRPEAPFRGTRGFWTNALYSTFVKLEKLLVGEDGWLQATEDNKRGDPHRLMVFTNTVLAECWTEKQGEAPDWGWVAGRREEYAAEVPAGALVLVAGVDIQDNRWELEVVGYGPGEESWGIEYKVGYGDPTRAAYWDDLDRALQAVYHHESGSQMHIAAAAVDSGGHHTQAVYDFCGKLAHRRVFAVKGVPGAGHPTLSATKRKGAHTGSTVDLFNIGVDGAKGLVYSRLRVTEPGPGYCHFPPQYTESYFEGLTAERLQTKKTKGIPQKVWVLPSGRRNEPLDIRVYAAAALKLLSPNWASLTAPFTGDTNPVRGRKYRSKGIQ